VLAAAGGVDGVTNAAGDDAGDDTPGPPAAATAAGPGDTAPAGAALDDAGDGAATGGANGAEGAPRKPASNPRVKSDDPAGGVNDDGEANEVPPGDNPAGANPCVKEEGRPPNPPPLLAGFRKEVDSEPPLSAAGTTGELPKPVGLI